MVVLVLVGEYYLVVKITYKKLLFSQIKMLEYLQKTKEVRLESITGCRAIHPTV